MTYSTAKAKLRGKGCWGILRECVCVCVCVCVRALIFSVEWRVVLDEWCV